VPRESQLGVTGIGASSGAGDGVRSDDEPMADVDAIGLHAGLSVPIDLGGYGALSAGLGLTEHIAVAARDDEDARTGVQRRTWLDVGIELSTTLLRRNERHVHLLRPHAAWRWRALEGATDDEGAPTVALAGLPVGFPHALELGLASRWLGADWALDATVLGVLFPAGSDAHCASSPCGIGQLDVRWQVSRLGSLGISGTLPSDDIEGWSGSGWVDLQLVPGSGEWWLGLRHDHLGEATWRAGAPSGLRVYDAWARLGTESLRRLAGDASERTTVQLGRSGPGLDFAVGGALLYERDLDGEADAMLGWTGDCGCWTIGVRGARHVIDPEWSAGVVLKLFDQMGAPTDEAMRVGIPGRL